MPSDKERRVVRVDRSPMNPKRWCLTLSCRHEVWISATRKPVRAYHSKCPKCEEANDGE